MKTRYEEIVNVASIGADNNPIPLNEILTKAGEETLTPAAKNPERVLVIGIDVQKDFMDNGALGVPGAHGDVERATRWIYENMDKISRFAVSIDTHNPFQIFHPCWWVDKNGNNPAPFTLITLKDLDDGKWLPVVDPVGSRDYVENLEKSGKKVLCIWPYHCIEGTPGHALESQFTNMLYFYSVAKKSVIQTIVKGTDPKSEMYGIIKPEYSVKNFTNLDFLNALERFDKIVIFGEASSHCVLESVQQMLDAYYGKTDSLGKLITNKVYILEDAMSPVISPVVDFPAIAKAAFAEFKNKYGVNLVTTTSFKL